MPKKKCAGRFSWIARVLPWKVWIVLHPLHPLSYMVWVSATPIFEDSFGGIWLGDWPRKSVSSLRDLLVELSEVQQGAHGLSSSWRLVVEKTFQKRMTRPSVGMWNALMIMNATPSHQVISIDASHIIYTWTRELGFAKRVWWWFLPKLFLEKRLQRNSKTLFRRQSPKTLTVLGVAWQKLNNTMQGGRLTEAAIFMLPSQNAITVERTVRSMVRCWTC